MELVVRNKTVIEFYKNHPHLDFEQVNLLLVNFLSNIIEDQDNGINKGLSMAILQQCSDSNIKVDLMSKDLLIRMMDLKKEYLDELKSQMNNYDGKMSDKILKQLEINTDILIGKTNTSLSSIILPTISDNVKREMNNSVNQFKNELLLEISKIKNKDLNIEEFIQNVEKRFQHQNDDFKIMMSNFTSEFASKIAKTDITLSEIREYFNKFSNSSLKGGLGENRLCKTLTKMFPTAEVLDMTNTKESGDIHLKRENKETILFETKEYVKNVGPAEVEKFIRDTTIQNLHGIFLSQSSGISSKNNLKIDYNNGKILVYVHNCEYCPDKIQMAIDIIDSLSSKIQENNQENIHTIPNEILDEINSEYKRIIDQRNFIISNIEKNNSAIIKLVKESIRLPKLEGYLEDKYGQVKKTSFVCPVCERSFENRTGLASHLKAHNKKESTIDN